MPLVAVACINHQLCLADDLPVIVVGVIGNDDDAVVLSQFFELGPLHLQIVLAALYR